MTPATKTRRSSPNDTHPASSLEADRAQAEQAADDFADLLQRWVDEIGQHSVSPSRLDPTSAARTLADQLAGVVADEDLAAITADVEQVAHRVEAARTHPVSPTPAPGLGMLARQILPAGKKAQALVHVDEPDPELDAAQAELDAARRRLADGKAELDRAADDTDVPLPQLAAMRESVELELPDQVTQAHLQLLDVELERAHAEAKPAEDAAAEAAAELEHAQAAVVRLHHQLEDAQRAAGAAQIECTKANARATNARSRARDLEAQRDAIEEAREGERRRARRRFAGLADTPAPAAPKGDSPARASLTVTRQPVGGTFQPDTVSADR